MSEGYYWYRDVTGVWGADGEWTVLRVLHRGGKMRAYSGEESVSVDALPGEFRRIDEPVD